MLNATDPDTEADSLTYSVLGDGSGGVVERADAPDTPVTSFTQADVDEGLILYHHTRKEAGNAKLTLQVILFR